MRELLDNPALEFLLSENKGTTRKSDSGFSVFGKIRELLDNPESAVDN
jgi:hypothetical protein